LDVARSGTAHHARRRLESLVVAWNVTVDRITETTTSLLAYGHRHRQPIVLKVIKAPGHEWRSGEIVGAFGGRAVVTVFEVGEGAMLLEQLRPGDPLRALVVRGEDDLATSILAETIASMSPSACPEWVPTVAEWGQSFPSYRRSQDARVPAALVTAAERVYGDLCGSQKHVRLLHGDLHHDNVLHDHARGWLAIDPKGVRGEVEFEIGAALRNPCDRPDRFAHPDVIDRRIDCFARRLGVDPARVLKWSFAQAVLAVIWEIEDGAPVDHDHRWLALARILGSRIGEHVG
jgi:streptomycin 6-kinase